MKAVYLVFFGIILGLSSCMWGDDKKPKPDITTDTLTYVNKTIKERATDCGNKPDSGCTVVKIKYPVFNKQIALNNTITNKITNLYEFDVEPAKDINHLAGTFFSIYRQSSIIYNLNIKSDVVRQDSSLSTVLINGYTFVGGAHGSSITTFINWNTNAQKNIGLGDIFTDNYKAQLTAIADTIFRKSEKLAITASLAKDYFFKDGKFSLNENYLITPLGIKFLYNEYEIKPYAAGQTEVFILYAKIKSLLKPNTVITQYHK